MLNLVVSCAHAQGNISIEDIGTEPAELIEGMSVPLFATLNNSGNTQVEIDLEFRLDSRNLSRHEGIVIEPETVQKKIYSDDFVSISLSNKTIEAVVYIDGREVTRKSAQITVQKKQVVAEEDKNNFIFWIFILTGVLLCSVFSIYLIQYVNRKKGTKWRSEKPEKMHIFQSEPVKQNPIPANSRLISEAQLWEIMGELSNDIKFLSIELKEWSEEKRHKEEYRLFIEYINNIASIVENIGNNNLKGAEQHIGNLKNRRVNLTSKLKTQKSIITPNEYELMEELKKQKMKVNHKKQFIDVLIPDFLLNIAEEKLHEGDIQTAKCLIFGAEKLLENDDVKQRLRKLREIGF